MRHLDRRSFLKESLLATAAVALPSGLNAQRRAAPAAGSPPSPAGPAVIDTFVNLFEWPYRDLKYSETPALVEKLKRHRISQAWAGSFEALFHKNVNAVNARLAEECRRHGGGLLLPFGTLNPAWPDWEEDLRRCDEVYGMRGIRLIPGYQHFGLGDPEFTRLLQLAGERGLVIQVVLEMEDSRVHHPSLAMRRPDDDGLLAALKAAPRTRVELLHWTRYLSAGNLAAAVADTDTAFDISGIEGDGGVGRLIEGNHWSLQGQVPADRLLFGSHAPYFPVETALLKLFESPLTLNQLQAIMRQNAERLMPRA